GRRERLVLARGDGAGERRADGLRCDGAARRAGERRRPDELQGRGAVADPQPPPARLHRFPGLPAGPGSRTRPVGPSLSLIGQGTTHSRPQGGPDPAALLVYVPARRRSLPFPCALRRSAFSASARSAARPPSRPSAPRSRPCLAGPPCPPTGLREG